MKRIRPVCRRQPWRLVYRSLTTALVTTSLVSSQLFFGNEQAAQAQQASYCQLSPEAIAQKESLRLAALQPNQEAKNRYKAILAKHAEEVQKCRRQTWPQNQALWLRLYPCDIQPGALDAVMDRIINRGYNQVYVEAFYNGQVLIPAAENRTAWPSVLRSPGTENFDLLAHAIRKGRERGLKVYAWMFSMNFGYSYAQRFDRQQVLARNGNGDTSLSATRSSNDLYGGIQGTSYEETFIDPYHPQARQDYLQVAQAVAQRRPDGMLFDYIRYPRGYGSNSVASKVQDLWIYGEASQQSLLGRALNQKGLELIRRFVSRGFITAGDIQAVNKLYPQEREPLWQGRVDYNKTLGVEAQPSLQQELWYLAVAHAVQGVLDFLTTISAPAQQLRIPTGAVFFPDGNQVVGQNGFDSRLQPWDRFPENMEWHPMSYGICGNTSCIVSQVRRVIDMAKPGTQIKPALAGVWGQSTGNRPSLEAQMQAIRAVAPEINSVSHFAYSWQEPQSDKDRKFCKI